MIELAKGIHNGVVEDIDWVWIQLWDDAIVSWTLNETNKLYMKGSSGEEGEGGGGGGVGGRGLGTDHRAEGCCGFQKRPREGLPAARPSTQTSAQFSHPRPWPAVQPSASCSAPDLHPPEESCPT